MNLKRTIISTFLILSASLLHAVVGTGGGAVPFLRTGVGARAAALSNAFTAYDDDSTLPYWNAAASSRLEKTAVSSMFSWLTQERKFNFFNAVFPTTAGSFSLNLINLSVGGIEGREGDTEDFYEIVDTENAYLLTYGKSLTEWAAVGAGFKYINIAIDKYGANGVSFDLSVLLSPADVINIGLALQDVSGSVRWSTGSVDKIPAVLRFGGLLKLIKGALNISMEAEQNEFSGIVLRQGIEAVFFDIISLRAGFFYGIKSYEFDYSLGAGANYTISGVTGQVDYALLREEFYSIVEIHHKLSISLYF